MILDLDDSESALPPWEFKVRVSGALHATRRPTLREMTDLARAARQDTLPESWDQICGIVLKLFIDPAPDLAAAGYPVLILLVRELLKYWRQYSVACGLVTEGS